LIDIITSQFFHTFNSQSFVMKIFMNTNETTYIQFNIHQKLHLKNVCNPASDNSTSTQYEIMTQMTSAACDHLQSLQGACCHRGR